MTFIFFLSVECKINQVQKSILYLYKSASIYKNICRIINIDIDKEGGKYLNYVKNSIIFGIYLEKFRKNLQIFK